MYNLLFISLLSISFTSSLSLANDCVEDIESEFSWYAVQVHTTKDSGYASSYIYEFKTQNYITNRAFLSRDNRIGMKDFSTLDFNEARKACLSAGDQLGSKESYINAYIYRCHIRWECNGNRLPDYYPNH